MGINNDALHVKGALGATHILSYTSRSLLPLPEEQTRFFSTTSRFLYLV
jgi:hypothetical protein